MDKVKVFSSQLYDFCFEDVSKWGFSSHIFKYNNRKAKRKILINDTDWAFSSPPHPFLE